VRVVEQAPSFSPVGAGITIQANATAVLDALGIEVPAEDVIPIGSVEVVDSQGRVLTQGDPDQILPEPPSINIHRADLHRALLSACDGIPLQTGRGVRRVSPDANGVEVAFEDRSSERYDLLIGADGLHSAVRRSIIDSAEPPPRYAGQTCWRFALDAAELVPTRSVERWGPGRRAGVIPLSRGRVYVYLVESAPPDTPGPGSATPEAVRERFGGIDAALDAVLARLDERVVIHHGDLCDRTRVEFGRGRVVLIGDAAHPMTPNAGQGAATAIEDAAALALLLPEHGGDLEGLVPALDALRRDRVTAVQRLAWRIGQVAHWKNPVACFARDRLLRSIPARAAAAQIRRLWDPGLELAARVARSATDS
jgi:2-polyprenyl-6-methoxyphenol hydroxylase-like FAD-dependent oxidoreductase